MEVHEAAEKVKAAGATPPRAGRDPVNLPMIRSWLEAIGDANPVYERDGLAPPAMIQVWTMRGLRSPDTRDPLQTMSVVLDEAGFPNVVATDCAQTYHRYLRVGEEVTVSSRLESVVGPKRTALGEGWFVTTLSTWFADGAPVADMRFRILRYRAHSPNSTPVTPPAPVITPDTAFFWDGVAAGELRIQRCGECGALRHPPGPACPRCGALRQEYVVASGAGTVHSFVVHHHPPVPGRRSPYVVALIDLAEGVRMVGPVAGTVGISDPVRADFADGLPIWRPDVPTLDPWTIDVSPTFVISTALATRDFQDVHHDRDAAVRRGGRDIFLNILTTTGLVQRYVTDWAGPSATVRGISLRLGAPCHAYDPLTFTGQVVAEGEVAVVGRAPAGDHVTATVRVTP